MIKKLRTEREHAIELCSALVPICKLLIKGGLGAGELIEASKSAYLQAAVSEVIPNGSRVNISRLSVATGLTRKEIAVLLKNKKSASAASPKKSTQQRALRILHGWTVDHSFQKPNGKPADLPPRGERRSFSLLVKRYGGDVTPVSALRELERMKAVSVTKAGKIKFRRLTPQSDPNWPHQMNEFTRLFKDFARTVQQLTEPKNPSLFFGFKDSLVASPHQAALFQRTFSKRAATLLESIDQWLAHQAQVEKRKPVASKPKKSRVGLGVYLIQDDG